MERLELWLYARAHRIVVVTEAFRTDLTARGVDAPPMGGSQSRIRRGLCAPPIPKILGVGGGPVEFNSGQVPCSPPYLGGVSGGEDWGLFAHCLRDIHKVSKDVQLLRSGALPGAKAFPHS